MNLLGGATLLLTLALLGGLAGGIVATRLIPSAGMGWDGIARALGGVMAGLLAALVLWVAGIRALHARARLVVSAIALALSVAAWWYLATTTPMARTGHAPAAAPPPPVQPFTFQLGASEAPDGSGTPVRMLWQFLRISSNLSFDYVPAGRSSQQCVAEHLADDLGGILRYAEFRTILAALPSDVDCGAPCPSCVEVRLEWFLDQDRSVLTLNDRCWHTHPAIQPLRTAVEGIVAAAYGRVLCS